MSKYNCFLAMFLTIFVLTGCTSYYESGSSNKYDDIVSISIYTKNQYDSGMLQLEASIKRDNLDSFEDSESISEIFSNDKYYYKSAMIDEDTVIVHKNTIFQSATGYVATKKNYLDTNEDSYQNSCLNVPENFGYDGNIVTIENYLGEFEGWYLYSYTAGL